MHPGAKFMEHADENNAAAWEDDWELAEEFLSLSTAAGPSIVPSSGWTSKGYMPCYVLYP